jgi:drug/metabolite transporter (DMT)-like permease
VVKGIEHGVSAGLAALIADLLPLGAALLSTLLLRTPLGRRVWAGLLVGAVGVALVTGDNLKRGDAPLWAYALPFAGMLSLALATLLQQRQQGSRQVNVMAGLWLQCAVSALAFGFVACLGGNAHPPATMGFAISVAWTAFVSTLGGYGLYWVCLQRSTAIRVTSVLLFSPAVTYLWAWIMFDEPLSWFVWIGGGLSASGVWLVVRTEAAGH